MSDPRELLQPILDLHARVRDEIVATTERQQIVVIGRRRSR